MAKPKLTLPRPSVLVTTDRKYRLELDKVGIAIALRNSGIRIPIDARVSFHVPGGGNWANTDIEIDEENPVYIEWTETKTEES